MSMGQGVPGSIRERSSEHLFRRPDRSCSSETAPVFGFRFPFHSTDLPYRTGELAERSAGRRRLRTLDANGTTSGT